MVNLFALTIKHNDITTVNPTKEHIFNIKSNPKYEENLQNLRGNASISYKRNTKNKVSVLMGHY